MSTVQHKVDMFNLANERRKAGLPSWAYTVRGFKAALESFDEDNFIEVRDKVVALIKTSRWYKEADEYGELWQVIDELTDVGHPDIDWDSDYDYERHFNDCLGQVYDLADWDRAWLA